VCHPLNYSKIKTIRPCTLAQGQPGPNSFAAMDAETILSRIKQMSSPKRAALFDAAKNLTDQSKLMLFLSLAAMDAEKIVDALLLPDEDDETAALISAVLCRAEADAMAAATASYRSM